MVAQPGDPGPAAVRMTSDRHWTLAHVRVSRHERRRDAPVSRGVRSRRSPARRSSALRDMRLWVAQRVRPDAFGRAPRGARRRGRAVCGVGCAAPLGAAAGGRALDGGLGVVLRRPTTTQGRTALLEVEPALAGALVARVLRRPPPRRGEPCGPALGGDCGGRRGLVVAAAARARMSAAAPLRVVSAGAAPARRSRTSCAAGSDGWPSRSRCSWATTRTAARLVLRAPARSRRRPPAWTAPQAGVPGRRCPSLFRSSRARPPPTWPTSRRFAGGRLAPGTWPLELATRRRGPTGSLRGPVLLAAPRRRRASGRGSSTEGASCYRAKSMRCARRRRT